MHDAKRDDELLLRAVMEHLPDAVWIRDADGRLITANAAAVRSSGIAMDALRGTRATDLVGGVGEEWERQDERVLATGEKQEVEQEIELAGVRRTLLTVKAPFRDASGRIGIVGIARDITERKQLEQVAKEASESLIRLQAESLRAVIEAQEQERERVGRSLHDNIGSMLSSLLYELDACAQAPHDEVAERIKGARLKGEGVMRALREISRGLHPPELRELGIRAAVEQLTAEWSRVYGVALDHDLSGLADVQIGAECAKALYRVLQEALTNVAKHAKAKRVSVVVVRTREQLRLTVEDDGAGLAADASRSGQGLRSIRERVRLLDGMTLLEATPGGGTTLHIQIPIERCRA